jgi:transcription elongation GreA/GreB family factor
VSPPRSEKSALWQELVRLVRTEVEALMRSHQETQAGATHEEAKPENDKDTRAIEQSYLARGQAARVEEASRALAALIALPLRHFTDDDPIALGALATLESDDGETLRVLVAPAGAGQRLVDARGEVSVITTGSPLGRALVGGRVGDSPEFNGPRGRVTWSIIMLE